MIFDKDMRKDVAKNPGEWSPYLEKLGKDSDDMKEIRDWKYSGLIKDARSLAVPRGLGEWADTKKTLLARYFPSFREGRKKDLRGYADVQVGKIYLKIVEEAEKRENRK
tara:strand:- start:1417 stop:1743 length:327 start_codon:yes stop_codon:yes gene_type:complete